MLSKLRRLRVQENSSCNGTDGPKQIVRISAPLVLEDNTLLRKFAQCAKPVGVKREPPADPPAEMNGIQWSYALLEYETLEDAERTAKEYNGKLMGRDFVITASLDTPSPIADDAPDVEQPFVLQCIVCGKAASKRCMLCHTYYCGHACQKKDFVKHEPICRVESMNVVPKPEQQVQKILQQSSSKTTPRGLSVMSLVTCGDNIPAEVFSAVNESIVWLQFKPAVLKDNAVKLLELYDKKKRHSDSVINAEFRSALQILELLASGKIAADVPPFTVLCSLEERHPSVKVGATVCLHINEKIRESNIWMMEVYDIGDTKFFTRGALIQWTFSSQSKPQIIEGGSRVRLASYVLPHAYLAPTKHHKEYVTLSQKLTEYAAKALPLRKLPFVGTHVLCIVQPDKIARRAAVLKVESSSNILVKFIDTGIEETVSEDQLKSLPASSLEHPQFAIRSELAGYSKDMEVNVVKEFLQTLTSVELTASVDAEGKVGLCDNSGNDTKAFFEQVNSGNPQSRPAGVNKRDLLLRRLRSTQ